MDFSPISKGLEASEPRNSNENTNSGRVSGSRPEGQHRDQDGIHLEAGFSSLSAPNPFGLGLAHLENARGSQREPSYLITPRVSNLEYPLEYGA